MTVQDELDTARAEARSVGHYIYKHRDRFKVLPWAHRALIMLTPRDMWPRRVILSWRTLGGRR